MIDFPASPTVNQKFTAAGATWVWDGAKWIAGGFGAAFVPIAGGAMTGDLSITGPDANNLQLSAPGAFWPGIQFKNAAAGKGAWLGSYVGANERWEIDLSNGNPETGGNSGSDFQIARYSDVGAFIDDPITIARATGIVGINNLSAPQAIGSNRIINGDMRQDQRNSGASGTAAAYTVDRWFANLATATKGTWQRGGAGASLFAVGFGYQLGFTSSSAYTATAAEQYNFQQRIEADMITDFAFGTPNAQALTLSFWVLSSLAGNFGGALLNNAPASATRSYPFTYNVPAANTWTQIIVNIPGDTAGTWTMNGNGIGAVLTIDLGSGSSNRGTAGAWASGSFTGVTGAVNVLGTNGSTFNFTGVKLETGSVCTPFNKQTIAKSLSDCQRYYQILAGISALNIATAASQVVQSSSTFMTAMRVTPSVTLSGFSYGNASGGVLGSSNANVISVNAVATGAGQASFSCTAALNSEL